MLEALTKAFRKLQRDQELPPSVLVRKSVRYAAELASALVYLRGVDSVGAGGDQRIEVETNHGDRATLGPDHPLRLSFDPETGEPAPYILVRGALEARLDRKSFFRLADLAVEEQRPEGAVWGVWSCGAFFALDDVTKRDGAR